MTDRKEVNLLCKTLCLQKKLIYYVKHCVYKRKTTDADKNFNRAQGSWT